jgi:16S rRNA (adenine1518-N6/adenine1519-N6)-dimethyltransferase
VTEHVQTKREIQAALERADLQPRKRFGQHFLIDGNLMRRLVESAELTEHDLVLEVGPGTGGLTDLLVPRAAAVLAVEIDHRLFDLLTDRFRYADRVTLLRGDVLDGKHRVMPAVAEAIRGFRAAGGAVKLVANLPYQVATPLIMNLLVDFPQVARMCFTVQAEVGGRIAAEPGGKDYGPLSILCQSLCTITTLSRIGPHCFWPAPQVDSVMLRLDVRERPLIARREVAGFGAFIRGVFDHRRKQLRTAVGYVLPQADFTPLGADFDAMRRPEELAIDEWVALYRELVAPTDQSTGRV